MNKFLFMLFVLCTTSFAQIKFDADFESGNLNSVSTSDSINYTVTTNTDIGGRWFYFRITGAKNKFIRVTITTSDVNRPVYSYNNKTFIRFTQFEAPSLNVFQKQFDEDTVYVAYYTPYTFAYLQERMIEWGKSQFVRIDTLGFTDKGLPIQEIVLTDYSVPDDKKYEVWIHARTHPGETPSSWHFDGVVQTLLGSDDVIDFYRKNIVFHLIPFTNPDGVYYGRSRTNYSGVDVESNWAASESATSTEVKILKKRMTEINKTKPLAVFLNLHSQVSSYCTTWIHTAESTSSRFYRQEYQISNLYSSDNPYFVQSDYRESTLRYFFPEGWLWLNNGHSTMALTYETPYDRYSNNTWVNNENLFAIGRRTVYAVAEYLNLSHPKHYLMDNKTAVINGKWNYDTTGVQFFSDNFLTAQPGSGNSSAAYITEYLESGKYDIYGWWPQSNSFAYNAKFKISADGKDSLIEKTEKINGGQWNYLINVSLKNTGIITVTLNDDAAGIVAADAFRIVYKEPLSPINEIFIPKDFVLYQNYPNPFNPATTIRFILTKNSSVFLRIFNILGKQITVLQNGMLPAGQHEIIFNVSNYPWLASGIYYYNLICNGHSETKGMILLK